MKPSIRKSFETWKVLKKENRKDNKEKKLKESKFEGKIKGRFKLNKLIIYIYLNSFYLFLSINLKIC